MTIWKISPWYKAVDWEYFFNEGLIYTGDFRVPGLGDLRNFNDKEDVKGLLERSGRSSNRGVLQQLWPFYENAGRDDLIIAYGDRMIWGIGKISGDYYYDGNHKWNVEWKEINPPLEISNDIMLFGNPPNSYGILNKQKTIIQIQDNEWDYLLGNYPLVRETVELLNLNHD